ncbi:MAG: Ig-like domain-containing protein, partial [Pseudomonadota bacterium]
MRCSELTRCFVALAATPDPALARLKTTPPPLLSEEGNRGASSPGRPPNWCGAATRSARRSRAALVVTIAVLGATEALACSPSPRLANGRLEGVVWMSGPLTGAKVVAFAADDEGAPIGESLGTSAPSGDDGSFGLWLGPGHGTIVLRVEGGEATYQDAATSSRATLDPGFSLSAVELDYSPDERRVGTVISPLTTMAVSLATARLARRDKEMAFADTAKRAYELVGAHFGDVPIGNVVPVDPTSATAAEPAPVTAAVRHGLVLAALSQLASAIATASQVSDDAIGAAALVDRLVSDLQSQEALFDGQGPDGPLSLGQCELPATCSSSSCDTLCSLDSNTVRSDLGAAFTVFLGSSRNATGLAYPDLAVVIEDLRANQDPELFPPDAPGKIDLDPPELRFVLPKDGEAVAGEIAIEVIATDATRVDRLEVTAAGTPVQDSDPAAERVLASLDTTQLREGPIVVAADAEDSAHNLAHAEVRVQVNNLIAGRISGWCIKGPLEHAKARAFSWMQGTRETLLGTDPDGTDSLGGFSIELEGYTGPVLVECGGDSASYLEEAFDAAVTLSSTDWLRTVLSDYADGEQRNAVVVTPYTSIAVAYLEHLLDKLPAGVTLADLSDRHRQAYQAVSSLLWVSDVGSVVPNLLDRSLSSITNEQSRYALELAGLSELALLFAARNGTVRAGSAVNALSLWNALETDVADGCLDGRAGETNPTGIAVVGVPLTSQTLRVELATAIAAFLAGPRNPTAITSHRDAIDLLEHLSSSKLPSLSGDPELCEPGELFPDDGVPFDREAPEIVVEPPTPAEGSIVRGVVQLKAHVVDDSPATIVLAEASLAVPDDDDASPQRVSVSLDTTTAIDDGPLSFRLEAEDTAGNDSSRTLVITADNTAPAIVVEGVVDEGHYAGPVIPRAAVTDRHPKIVAVSLDDEPFVSGTKVELPGRHRLSAFGEDLAGNTSTLTVVFTIDGEGPTILWDEATPPGDAVVSDTLVASAIASDPNGIAEFTIEQPATAFDGASAPDVILYRETFAEGIESPRALLLRAVDSFGNRAVSSRAWRIDTMSPRIAIAGVSDGAFYRTPVSPTFSVEDANLASLAATLDSNELVNGVVVELEGSHVLEITALDQVGHRSTASLAFTIDYHPPEITWTSPPDGSYWHSDFLLEAAATDENLEQTTGALRVVSPAFLAGLDGDAAPERLATTFRIAEMADGIQRIELCAKDRAGNASCSNRIVVVDRVSPTIAVTTAPAVTSEAWSREPVAARVTIEDPNRDPEAEDVSCGDCTLRATTETAAAKTWELACSSDGSHAIAATAVDRAGNTQRETLRFFVDATPPTITIESAPVPSAACRGQLELSAVLDDALKGEGSLDAQSSASISAQVMAGGAPVASLARSILTDGRQMLTVQLDTTKALDGPLTVVFSGTDRAGNEATPVLRTVVVDNTPPEVTIDTVDGVENAAGLVNHRDPALAGSLSEKCSVVTVRIGTNPCPVARTDSTWMAWPYASLSEGVYAIAVTATDAAGNVGTATGTIGVDLTKPEIALVPSAIADESALPVSFDATTAEPGYGTTSKVTNLDASTPLVSKLVTRFADHTVNPIEWRFNVTDGRSGVDATKTWYAIQPPAGGGEEL